jgi:phospholipid/cholesterol/gamma-HCH transport system substrate-binding protein
MNKKMQLGTFFVLGIVTLLVLFEVVSGVDFLKKENTYISYFSSVGELRVGNEVKLSGVEVGKVKKITLSGQNVAVKISVEKNVVLKDDSIASINMTSLLGSTYVGITFGSPGSRVLSDGGVLLSSKPVDFNSLVTKLDKTVDMFNSQLFEYNDKIKSILFNLNIIVSNVANSKGTIGKLVNDPSIYEDLKLSLDFISNITKKIDQGDGTLGLLINDESVYNEAKNTLQKISKLTDKLSSGDGSLGKLINDDQLYDSINTLSENLNSLVAKINSGEGTLGKLINDDRLYYDALNSVRKLKNATETQEDLAPLTTISAAFGVMTLF